MSIMKLIGFILLLLISSVLSAEIKLTNDELRSLVCESQWDLSNNKTNHVKFSDDGKARFYKERVNGEVSDTGNKLSWSLTDLQKVKVGPTTYVILKEKGFYLFKVIKSNKENVKVGAIHYRKEIEQF